MEHLRDLLGDSTMEISIKVKAGSSSSSQLQLQAPSDLESSISVVKEIRVELQVEAECHHFQVVSTTPTLVSHHHSPTFFIAAYQLPVHIFNRGICDNTLQRFLSWQFKEYEDCINIPAMTHQIINHWLHVKREAAATATTRDCNDNSNSIAFGRVFPLEVTLHLWNSVIEDDDDDDYVMVPASEVGIEKMLKTVKFEEIVLKSATTCVICLEEITTMPNQDIDSGMLLVQMPCLHVFHQKCIIKWLNNSHYCPTCRFKMPTN